MLSSRTSPTPSAPSGRGRCRPHWPPFAPEMLAVLDRLARRYGVDPWTVMRWSPERLGLAMAAMEAGVRAEMELGKVVGDKGMCMPVFVIGGG